MMRRFFASINEGICIMVKIGYNWTYIIKCIFISYLMETMANTLNDDL